MSEKLLIADDDIFVLKTIQSTLSDEECESVDFCTSPEEAFELMDSNEYRRVISDWRFLNSELDGFDVLARATELGIQEKVLMTSVSRIRDIDDADSFCGMRKPLSKANVKSICFGDFDQLERMSSISR